MDAKFINPILEAIVSIVKSMGKVEPKPGKAEVKKDIMARGEITGLMLLTGSKATVSIAVTFQENVIRSIAENMLPPDAPKTRGSLADLAGELANMIAGETKQRLEAMNYTLDMSLPVIIYGPKHAIAHQAHGPTVLLPLSTEVGGFFVEFCYEG